MVISSHFEKVKFDVYLNILYYLVLIELFFILKKVLILFYSILFYSILFYSFCLLGPHLWHMEVPRLGVDLELQLSHSHSNAISKLPDLSLLSAFCKEIFKNLI